MAQILQRFKLPIAYTTFFLFIEPISALVGAFYAHFLPLTYLSLTHAPSSPSPSSLSSTASPIPLGTNIVLTQLSNLYLLFALNEALVLRSTSDLRVWRTVLFGLLIADFGHLYSVCELGTGIYWRAWEWNAMAWGNIGFVYLGASMRMAFLAGVGLGARVAVEATEKSQARKEREKKGT